MLYAISELTERTHPEEIRTEAVHNRKRTTLAIDTILLVTTLILGILGTASVIPLGPVASYSLLSISGVIALSNFLYVLIRNWPTPKSQTERAPLV